MSTKIQNIAKNTSFFTLALVIQKVITFSYFTILARNLIPEDLGRYYLAMSFSLIFVTLIDFGQTTVITREVAKDSKKTQNYIATVMAIKIPLIILTSITVFVLVNLLNYPEFTKNLIYLSILLMIFDSLAATFFSVIRGFHNLFFESISSVATQLLIMIIGVSFLYAGYSIFYLMIAMIFGSMFRFFFSLGLLSFKWRFTIKPTFDFLAMKNLILLSLPFALYGIFLKIQSHIDTVLLSKLAGDFHVGIYQIAFKIVFALQFLPIAFIASLYPAFSTYWKDKNEQLSISFERAFSYLNILSLPITVGVFLIADKIILVFKPEYISAIPVMKVAILALPFLFLIYPTGALLNACDKQKINTRNMGITLCVSFLLNFILITRYNSLGASIAILLSNAFMLFISLFEVKKTINFRFQKMFIQFFKTLSAAILMGFSVWFFKPLMNIFAVVALSAFLYLFLILSMGITKKEEVFNILRTFKK